MEYSAELAADIRKIWDLIKDIKIAMFVSEQNGALRSRPMANQSQEFDGKLWFFTRESSPKVDELADNSQVNVAFADPDHQTYISLSGKASMVRDHKKMAELWDPSFERWVEKGLDNPDLALIRVDVETAEYWTAPPSKVVQFFGSAKASIAGQKYETGDHDKIELI